MAITRLRAPYADAKAAAFLALVAAGKPINKACARVGINASILKYWRLTHREFDRAYQAAKAEAAAIPEDPLPPAREITRWRAALMQADTTRN